MKKISFLLVIALMMTVSIFALTACPGDNDPESITAHGFQTQYLVGQSFNRAEGHIVVRYTNGDTREVPLTNTDITISGFDASQAAASQRVTLTYRGLSTSINVEIAPITSTLSIVGQRANYIVGQQFDRSSGHILVSYSDNTSRTVALDAVNVAGDYLVTVLRGFDTSTPTEAGREVVLRYATYMAREIRFSISVSAATPQSIQVVGYRRVQAQHAPHFDRGRATVNVVYTNGNTSTRSLSDIGFEIHGFNSAIVGYQTVYVRLADAYYRLNIEVRGGDTPISIVAGFGTALVGFPAMIQGDIINTDLVRVNIERSNGENQTNVPFNDLTGITIEYDRYNIGPTNVYVIYREAVSVRVVNISENFVRTINMYIAALEGSDVNNPTAEQIRMALRVVHLYTTHFEFDRLSIPNLNSAGLDHAILVAFVQNYSNMLEYFEFVTGNMSDAIRYRHMADMWIESAEAFLDAVDALLILQHLDHIVYNGISIADRIEAFVIWIGENLDVIFQIDALLLADIVYQIFIDIDLSDRSILYYQLFNNAVIEAMYFLIDLHNYRSNLYSAGVALEDLPPGPAHLFFVLNHWNYVIFEAMTLAFAYSDFWEEVNLLHGWFVLPLFSALNDQVGLALEFFNWLTLGMMSDNSVLLFLLSDIELMMEALNNSNRWFHQFLADSHPMVNLDPMRITIGDNEFYVWTTIQQAFEMMMFGEFYAWWAPDAISPFTGHGRRSARIGQNINGQGVFTPTFVFSRGVSLYNPTVDELLDKAIDMIAGWGHLTDYGWQLNPLAFEEEHLQAFSQEIRSVFDEFLAMPGVYQFTFLQAMSRVGLVDETIMGGNILLHSWELTYFGQFVHAYFTFRLGQTPAGAAAAVLGLFELMMDAIDYHMYGTTLTLDRQLFVSRVTAISSAREGLTTAQRNAFDETAGFLYQYLVGRRALFVSIIAGTYSPNLGVWLDDFERVALYIDAFEEIIRRGDVRAHGIALIATYARIRQIRDRIVDSAPPHIVEAFFNFGVITLNVLTEQVEHNVAPGLAIWLVSREVLFGRGDAGGFLNTRLTMTGEFDGLGLRYGIRGRFSDELWDIWADMFELAWGQMLRESAAGMPIRPAIVNGLAAIGINLSNVTMANVANILYRVNNLNERDRYAFFAASNMAAWSGVAGEGAFPAMIFDHQLIITQFLDLVYPATGPAVNAHYRNLLNAIVVAEIYRLRIDLLLGPTGAGVSIATGVAILDYFIARTEAMTAALTALDAAGQAVPQALRDAAEELIEFAIEARIVADNNRP